MTRIAYAHSPRIAIFTACMTVLLAAASTAHAENEGITVVATGQTSSPPDRIEMAVNVVGSAELAGEAATKYRGQRERLLEALSSLGVEDLKTRPGTVTVTGTPTQSPNQYGQVVPNANAGAFSVTEKVVIDLPAGDAPLDTITKIYDVGKDLGVTFVAPRSGSNSLVQPRFVKTEESEAAAYKSGMEQARRKATVLAGLAGEGVSLGKVLSVSASKAVATTHNAQQIFNPYMGTMVSTGGLSESDSLSRQKTSISLTVRFELK